MEKLFYLDPVVPPKKKPKDVLSITNQVVVHFHSDHSNQKSGFKLTWTVVPSFGFTSSPFVVYSPGDINLLFTVPHDGENKPDSIQNRVNGCKDSSGQCKFPGSYNCLKDNRCRIKIMSDAMTRNIAETAREELINLGLTPHLVISKLHRSKMDPNRDEYEAAQGRNESIQAYRAFHSTIKKVRDIMAGPGLVLDFHGHAHEENIIELGYLISGENLNKSKLSGPTSISSLVDRSPYYGADLIIGSAGLGAEIEGQGYSAVPSPKKACPGKDKYFSGGTIIQRYGSRDGGKVDAIQIEMPKDLRKDLGLEARTKFAKKLGRAIAIFFQKHYISSLMAIGGIRNNNYNDLIQSTEVLTVSCDNEIPLYGGRTGHISVTTEDGRTLVCGGMVSSYRQPIHTKNCIQFNFWYNTWDYHSHLTSEYRSQSVAIALKHGTYILGGFWGSQRSSEFLATGSSTWTTNVPQIPGNGMWMSCGVKLSDTEFVIIGGMLDETQVRMYSTTKKVWTEWTRLRIGVYGQSCVKFGDEILIAGGISSYDNEKEGRKTLIYNIEKQSVREVAPLKYIRFLASMVIYQGKPLIMGGTGQNGKRGEVWNNWAWEKAEFSLDIAREGFTLVAMDKEVKCGESIHDTV